MEATGPATTLLLNEARAVQAVPTEDTIWHLIGFAQLNHKRNPQDAATAVRLALGLFGEVNLNVEFLPPAAPLLEIQAEFIRLAKSMSSEQIAGEKRALNEYFESFFWSPQDYGKPEYEEHSHSQAVSNILLDALMQLKQLSQFEQSEKQ